VASYSIGDTVSAGALGNVTVQEVFEATANSSEQYIVVLPNAGGATVRTTLPAASLVTPASAGGQSSTELRGGTDGSVVQAG
jgi:hypothetical protein